ncbi:unnamed protein product, partial [Prorocentrum cordatum]
QTGTKRPGAPVRASIVIPRGVRRGRRQPSLGRAPRLPAAAMSAREALDGSQALTDSASARAASGGRSTSPCSERSGGRERQRRGTGTSSCRLARELEGLSLAELRAKATQSDKDIKDYARSLCKKKWTEEVKRKQRIEEAISELESAGPDGVGRSAEVGRLDGTVCLG